MNYILGGVTGHSFVVGYGPNPPQQPHHRAASCPPLGQQCTWDYFNSRAPNPHTLYGALVGGPNGQDVYDDNRNNFIQNEVGLPGIWGPALPLDSAGALGWPSRPQSVRL
jgi:hypothetical protein